LIFVCNPKLGIKWLGLSRPHVKLYGDTCYPTAQQRH